MGITENLNVLGRDPGSEHPLPADVLTETGVLGRRLAVLTCRDSASRSWGPKWLERDGFQTRLLSQPSEILDAVQRLEPSVVIIDAALQDADGLALYQRIQQIAPMLPVVVLCGSARELQQAVDSEATDVVRKPFDWRLISRRAALAARSYHSIAELDTAQTALRKALNLAEDARRHLERTEGQDALTELPNRQRFIQLVDRAIGISRRDAGDSELTLLIIGLERFHQVNEALGHENGNRLLAEVAERIRDCLRRPEVLRSRTTGPLTAAAGRVGGVRFALVVSHADVADTLRLQTALREALTKPYEIAGQTVYVTAAIGAAVFPKDATRANSLLQNAEIAMAEAKWRGGGFRFFRELDDKASGRKLLLDRMLREALEQNQLRLAFQPLVDLGTGRIVGAEALLRWNHPEQGEISPGEFVPVAEESGLIVEIGRRVIAAACRQMRQWRDAGVPTLRVAVNVSVCQLHHGDLADVVERALLKYRIDPGCLELELSERGVMSRDADTLRQLHKLKRLGVRLSIDDFGTGQSSIAYLKELPIDTLKIDRSYVSGLQAGGKDSAIASAMVTLAHGLNLTVVGEGVETEEQLALLQAWGCHQYQGFLYSPAISAGELAGLQSESVHRRREPGAHYG